MIWINQLRWTSAQPRVAQPRSLGAVAATLGYARSSKATAFDASSAARTEMCVLTGFEREFGLWMPSVRRFT